MNNSVLSFAQGPWQEAVVAGETRLDIGGNMCTGWIWTRGLIDPGDCLVGPIEPGDPKRACQNFQQSLDMFTGMGALKVLEERLGDM